MITVRSQKVDRCKALLANKLNQVYYEMYVEKIGKELKTVREITTESPEKEKVMRVSMNHATRKMQKVGNTTSTSLNRYNTHREQNDTVKTAFYHPNDKMESLPSRTDT